ncbi:hypothetical protein [Roseiarcus sp.]|uniref:hypothetical protein n=1 Tax=Roseiarcus sp. TaxID=1969460 RepID=UPI003F94BA83
MQNAAKTGPETGAAATGAEKASLEERAVDELKHYAIITLYLWVLFLLFATYKHMLLHENGISVWNESFAIVNALIFGKVILIFQALNLGRRLTGLALAWIVLGRSLMFTIVLILFHIAEEAIRAWFKDLPLATSIEDFGGGTLLGFATYTAIFFVALIPFFAISEVAEIIGADALWNLMFTSGRKAFKLFQE